MEKNIMLAFVSPVNAVSLNNPINYTDVQGQPYRAIQTNESAIVFVERMLGAENSLSQIFLIASDSVKSDKVPSENEFGDVTHLEFLRRRIAKEFPQLADKFSVQDYSEEGSGSDKLEKNILQIAQIADAVTAFARQNSGDKIKVHADMTGGFRHTSMFMLSIIQLLKYRGIEIGEVLYSEPKSRVVYRMTEIQRMFSLITGADEFVKFGSVEALREYFGDTPPDSVKDLLTAMNRFSDAIKICRTSAIEGELKNLGQHIKTFRQNPDKDLKSELFAKIIDTIELEYGTLTDDAAGRLDIIRWCMKKGFWQQAMTLCTEWLPEEIINRKICTPKNFSVIRNAAIEGNSFGRNWQQQLIIAYQGAERTSVKVTENEVNAFVKSLRNALENPASNKFPPGMLPELEKFFSEYRAGKISFNSYKGGAVINFKKKFPTLSAVLRAIYDDRKKNLNYKKDYYRFLQTVHYEKILSSVAKLNSEKLLKLFKIDRAQISDMKPELEENSGSKWKNREKVYREMFDKKIINSAFDLKTTLKILHGYYEIRHERNQVNHANAHASKKISDLKAMIETYLDSLEKIPPQ